MRSNIAPASQKLTNLNCFQGDQPGQISLEILHKGIANEENEQVVMPDL